jgi:hypothetical protein
MVLGRMVFRGIRSLLAFLNHGGQWVGKGQRGRGGYLELGSGRFANDLLAWSFGSEGLQSWFSSLSS